MYLCGSILNMDTTGTILRPTRWSYSSLSTYKDCPLQYKLSYIDKLDEGSPGTGASRGTRLHQNVEDYIKQDLVQLEKDLLPMGPELMRMKAIGWKSEEVWLIDRQWDAMEEESPATYAKAIVDLHYFDGSLLEIIDVKSGRRYPEHEEQLQIYALMGMKRYPTAKRVDVAAWYVDEKGAQGHRASYLPQMFDHYVERWDDLARRMFDDQEFVPTPSKTACRWCSFKASKGGPCQDGDMW